MKRLTNILKPLLILMYFFFIPLGFVFSQNEIKDTKYMKLDGEKEETHPNQKKILSKKQIKKILKSEKPDDENALVNVKIKKTYTFKETEFSLKKDLTGLNLDNCYLNRCRFEGLNLSNSSFARCFLGGCTNCAIFNCGGSDSQFPYFMDVNLTKADFSESEVHKFLIINTNGLIFEKCNLSSANFSNFSAPSLVQFRNSILQQTIFSQARGCFKFSNSSLSKVSFYKTFFKTSEFINSTIIDSIFDESEGKITLKNVDISNVDFSKSHLDINVLEDVRVSLNTKFDSEQKIILSASLRTFKFNDLEIKAKDFFKLQKQNELSVVEDPSDDSASLTCNKISTQGEISPSSKISSQPSTEELTEKISQIVTFFVKEILEDLSAEKKEKLYQIIKGS